MSEYNVGDSQVTLIGGVGKTISKKLVDNGYTNVRSVAESTPDEICSKCNIRRQDIVDVIKRARIIMEFPNGVTSADSDRVKEIRSSKI